MSAAAELLREMIAVPSPSGGEAALAHLLVERMSALGFDAHVDGAGNAVGVRRGPDEPGAQARELVLLGHMDTVPGNVPQRTEGDLIWGRGAVDAKGPLCAFVRAVGSVEPAPGVTLTVVGAVEEEAPTSRGARFVARRPAPEACIIGEPSGWDAVTVGYKGALRVEYRAEQPGGHGAGPLPAVAERATAFWEAARAWCAEHDAGRERLFERVLPSLRAIRTSSDGLTDVVEASFGFRLPPDFDVERLRAFLAERAEGAELRFHGHEVAWTSPRTTPLARALLGSIRAAGGEARAKHKTGTSDMNVLGPVWGCPIVAYGPGDSTLDHTPNEHLSIAELERSIEVLRGALARGGWAQP